MKYWSAMDNGCFKNAGVASPEENDDAFCLFEVCMCVGVSCCLFKKVIGPLFIMGGEMEWQVMCSPNPIHIKL